MHLVQTLKEDYLSKYEKNYSSDHNFYLILPSHIKI